jgi:hypothetical protein
MIGAELARASVYRHEHCYINGKWSCRVGLVWRPKRKVVPMGQFTERPGTGRGFDPECRWAVSDEDFATLYPALYEFLAEQVTEAGVPRVTSTLLLSAEEGLWKACLIDRAQKGSTFDYTLWKSGATLQRVLCSLDESIRDGSAEWRKRPKWEAQKKR